MAGSGGPAGYVRDMLGGEISPQPLHPDLDDPILRRIACESVACGGLQSRSDTLAWIRRRTLQERGCEYHRGAGHEAPMPVQDTAVGEFPTLMPRPASIPAECHEIETGQGRDDPKEGD